MVKLRMDFQTTKLTILEAVQVLCGLLHTTRVMGDACDECNGNYLPYNVD